MPKRTYKRKEMVRLRSADELRPLAMRAVYDFYRAQAKAIKAGATILAHDIPASEATCRAIVAVKTCIDILESDDAFALARVVDGCNEDVRQFNKVISEIDRKPYRKQ